ASRRESRCMGDLRRVVNCKVWHGAVGSVQAWALLRDPWVCGLAGRGNSRVNRNRGPVAGLASLQHVRDGSPHRPCLIDTLISVNVRLARVNTLFAAFQTYHEWLTDPQVVVGPPSRKLLRTVAWRQPVRDRFA